jgi:hypothetical protein
MSFIYLTPNPIRFYNAALNFNLMQLMTLFAPIAILFILLEQTYLYTSSNSSIFLLTWALLAQLLLTLLSNVGISISTGITRFAVVVCYSVCLITTSTLVRSITEYCWGLTLTSHKRTHTHIDQPDCIGDVFVVYDSYIHSD